MRRARGFTLMELMVVVIMVAILAALAIPSMIRARDDRHAYDDAATLGLLLRSARLRAVGRGAAVAVHLTVNGSSDLGTFLVYESVTDNPVAAGGTPVSDPTNRTPVSSCINSDWTQAPGSGNALLVDGTNFNGPLESSMNLVTAMNVTYLDATSAAKSGTQADVWLCYTPGGRAYISVSGAAFDAANMLVDLDVSLQRNGTGITRHVLVPSTGIARLYSH